MCYHNIIKILNQRLVFLILWREGSVKKILLIVFALIVLLISAFVVFVMSIDWNEHKAKIAEQFSTLTGKRVVFEGDVELSFFPSPYLTVENVKIYNANLQDKNPLAQINRLVANLELMPFIKGEFNVKEMSLKNPIVNIQVDENGLCNWDTELTAEQRTRMAETPVKLDSLSIEKATLTVKDSRKGIDWFFENLSAEVMADSLLGPFRIEGSYVKDNNPAGFAFSIGRLDTSMSTSISAVINNPASQTILRFDGSVLPQQDLLSGSVSFEANKLKQFITENFKNVVFDDNYDYPLAFSAQLNINSQKAEITDLAIKYGDTAGAGNVIIPLNKDNKQEEESKIEVVFNMTDLDLEPVVYFLHNEVSKYKESGKFVLNMSSDVIADIKAVSVKYGKHQARNAEISVDVLSQKINVNTLKATLAGDAKMEMWGAISAGKEGEMKYQSEVRLRTDELITLLKTLDINPPMPVSTVYRNFNGVAQIDGGFNEVKFTPVEFILDKTKVTGEAAVVFENEKPRMLVIADIDGVNFDNYLIPMSDDIRNGSLNQKLLYVFSQTKSLKDTDLQCHINLGWGIYDNLPFEKAELEAKIQNGVWDIAKLNIPSVSGASVDVSGKIKGYGDIFEFEALKYKLESADIFAWLSKFSAKLPDWELENFKKFSAEGMISGSTSSVNIDNSSKLDGFEFNYKGSIIQQEKTPIYNGKIYLKSPDFLKMLKNFKIDYAPNVYSLGVFSLNSDIETKDNNMLELQNLNVSIGQNLFQGHLNYVKDGLTKKINGNLFINQFEPERFFYNGVSDRENKETISFKTENEEVVNFLPKPIWNTTKINYGLYKNLELNLDMVIEKLVYKNTLTQNNKFNLQLNDNLLKLNNIDADYAKGKINGNVNLNFNAVPVIDGNIDLIKVNLDERFWAGEKYGFNYGTIVSSTKFSAGAESVDNFIKSMEAECDFKLNRVEFKGFNPLAIEEDLQKRNNVDGLAKFVKEQLESGKTPLHSISGKMKINKGDYSFENMNFSSPLGYTLMMDAKGSLLLWDVNAQFSLGFRKVSLPALKFAFKGSLASPELSVDVTPITDFYQKQKDEFAAQQKEQEEMRLRNLQAQMNEQMNVVKAMKNRLNDSLYAKLKQIRDSAKSDKAIADLTNIETELDNIAKGTDEVMSLASVPKVEQQQIDEARRRNGLLQKRIDNAENTLSVVNVEDIKYRTNTLYNDIVDIHNVAKNKLNDYKQYYDNLKKRLAKIQTDYSLEGDVQAAAYNAVIESLFVELDDINSSLTQEYIKMQNTVDVTMLIEYEKTIMDKLSKATKNQNQLSENIDIFKTYALPQIETQEQMYSEKMRQEEIARKVKENTGKISVAGVGGKSVTIVRDIEEIEKSEDLQEKASIPVLDFTGEKKENVIINREARLPQKTQNEERTYLMKSQGKISGATGVIVRK